MNINQNFRWDLITNLMFRKDKFKEAEQEIDAIINFFSLNQESKVLDLCCGPGRHCIPLARKGCQIVGVDITQAYLDLIKNEIEGETLNLELIKYDKTKYIQENEFDLILNLWDSFGNVEPDAEYKSLENSYLSLKKGGAVVIQYKTVEVFARNFSGQFWFKVDDLYLLFEESVTPDWRKVKLKCTVFNQENERVVHEIESYLYSTFELCSMLKKVGFKDIKLYENFKGSAFNVDSEDIVLIGYK